MNYLSQACLAATLSLMIASCVNVAPSFRKTSAKMDRIFGASQPQPKSFTTKVDGREVHFVDTGEKDKPLVIFVHGSPGSWDADAALLGDADLRKRARLVSVDRPGFGRSQLGDPLPSLAKQSKALGTALTLDRFGKNGGAGNKAILVGHSYGGPLVARMAMDYPDRVGGIIMVAPAIDPKTQNAPWFQLLGAQNWLRWFTPRSLYSTCVELVALHDDLVEMLPRWKDIEVPSIVIQGGRDFLVPPTVADFAERELVNAPKSIRRYPKKDHFIPFLAPELIKKALIDLLDGKKFEN